MMVSATSLLFDPFVHHVVKIDVGKQWRDHRHLRCAFCLPISFPVFVISRLEPFSDKAQCPFVADSYARSLISGIWRHRVRRMDFVLSALPSIFSLITAWCDSCRLFLIGCLSKQKRSNGKLERSL